MCVQHTAERETWSTLWPDRVLQLVKWSPSCFSSRKAQFCYLDQKPWEASNWLVAGLWSLFNKYLIFTRTTALLWCKDVLILFFYLTSLNSYPEINNPRNLSFSLLTEELIPFNFITSEDHRGRGASDTYTRWPYAALQTQMQVFVFQQQIALSNWYSDRGEVLDMHWALSSFLFLTPKLYPPCWLFLIHIILFCLTSCPPFSHTDMLQFNNYFVSVKQVLCGKSTQSSHCTRSSEAILWYFNYIYAKAHQSSL